jgi:hypothetical protein
MKTQIAICKGFTAHFLFWVALLLPYDVFSQGNEEVLKKIRELDKKTEEILMLLNKKGNFLQSNDTSLSAVYKNQIYALKKDSVDKIKKIREMEAKQIEEAKKYNDKLQSEKSIAYDNGLLFIKNQIKELYSQPMDSILKKVSVEIIKRDLAILNGIPELAGKVEDALYYFNMKEKLNEKLSDAFIQQTIKPGIDSRANKYNSSVFKNLGKTFSTYIYCKPKLKNLILDIAEFDKKEGTANGIEALEEQKKAFVATLNQKIFSHQYNYPSLFECVYLRSVFFEVVDKKWENPDADISYLLEKLKD